MMTPVWVGAGVGVAGFVTAIVFGVLKGSAQNSYNTQVATIQSGLSAKGIPLSRQAGMCAQPSSDVSLTNACASLTSDGNDVNNDATVANVGIAVGIVGVGFAAGWYLFAPKDTAQGSKTAWPRIQPMVGPRVGGLSLGGAF